MKTINKKGKRAGFTLVELLVVIMIIVALIGFGSVGLRKALQNAEETKVRQVCRDLVIAIEQFRMDHNGNFPIEEYPDGDGDLYIRTDESNSLMQILTNREKGLDRVNQAGKVYFSTKESKAKSDGLYIGPAEEVGLYDSWKMPYYVVMDTNMDDELKDPSDPGNPLLRGKKVLVFSAGADMKIGKDNNEDNINSWK